MFARFFGMENRITDDISTNTTNALLCLHFLINQLSSIGIYNQVAAFASNQFPSSAATQFAGMNKYKECCTITIRPKDLSKSFFNHFCCAMKNVSCNF